MSPTAPLPRRAAGLTGAARPAPLSPLAPLALWVASALVLAGCAAPPTPAGPEDEARALLDGFLRDFFDPGGMFASAPGVAGWDMAGTAGGAPVAGSHRRAPDGSTLTTATAPGATTRVHCGPGGYVEETGGEAVLSRRVPGLACGAFLRAGIPGDARSYALRSTGPDPAGLRASFSAGSGGPGSPGPAVVLNLTGAPGRLAGFEVARAGGLTAGYTVVHGPRAALDPPEPTARVPAGAVILPQAPDARTWRLHVAACDEQPPFAELEVHVVRPGDATAGGDGSAALAVFPMRAGTQRQGDWTLEVVDPAVAPQGRLSQGDELRVASAGDAPPFEVVLWDRWAGGPVRVLDRPSDAHHAPL